MFTFFTAKAAVKDSVAAAKASVTKSEGLALNGTKAAS